METTPQAKKRWESIPNEVRMKILNNVWCGDCRTSVNLKSEKMSISDGMLKIDGKCMACSGPVCRVIENE